MVATLVAFLLAAVIVVGVLGPTHEDATSTATTMPRGEVTHMGEPVTISAGTSTAVVTVGNPHAVEGGTALDVKVEVQPGATAAFTAGPWSLVRADGQATPAARQPGDINDSAFWPGGPRTTVVAFHVELATTEGGAVVLGAEDWPVATWRLG